MATLRTWWRTLGGLMVVAFAMAFVTGSAIDALACQGETNPSVGVAGDLQHAVVAMETGSESDLAHGAAEACAHGHCHHLAGLGLGHGQDANAPRPSEPHGWAVASFYPDLDPSGLERPPRA
jgi:hypothetical protein